MDFPANLEQSQPVPFFQTELDKHEKIHLNLKKSSAITLDVDLANENLIDAVLSPMQNKKLSNIIKNSSITVNDA